MTSSTKKILLEISSAQKYDFRQSEAKLTCVNISFLKKIGSNLVMNF